MRWPGNCQSNIAINFFATSVSTGKLTVTPGRSWPVDYVKLTPRTKWMLRTATQHIQPAGSVNPSGHSM